MTILTTERIFTSGDLPLLSLPRADGLITCRWLHDPVVMMAEGEGGVDAVGERRHTQVGFVMVESSWLARAAAERLRTTDIDAVVMHVQAGLPGRSALALAFASHLRLSRSRTGLEPHVLTSGTRPDLSGLEDQIRVPHPVTISDATGAIADTIVWEVMTAERFDAWLDGAPRPDQRAIEAHLPGLLRLRALLRAGLLDQCRAGALLDVLDGGALSARLIHRCPRIVLPLAAAAA